MPIHQYERSNIMITLNKKVQFKNKTSKIVINVNICGGRLSITGTESHKSGRPGARFHEIGWGQLMGSLREHFGDDAKAQAVLKVWKRWHLNDMRPGNEAQERFLDAHGRRGYNYDCKVLKDAGMLVNAGYKYGSGWVKEELPQSVIEEIAAW